MKNEEQNKLIVFESKAIRRVWHNEEWWYSVSDIVEALIDTKDVRQYIKRMRSREVIPIHVVEIVHEK